jgi:hypothetical protein
MAYEATHTIEPTLSDDLIAQIEGIVVANEEYYAAHPDPDQPYARAVIGSELNKVRGAYEALTAESFGEMATIASDNDFARTASVIGRIIEPETKEKLIATTARATRALSDLKERYPKHVTTREELDELEAYEIKQETDAEEAWKYIDEETEEELREAAKKAVPKGEKLASNLGLVDDRTFHGYRNVLIERLSEKTGINIPKMYLKPKELLDLYESVREETRPERIAQIINERLAFLEKDIDLKAGLQAGMRLGVAAVATISLLSAVDQSPSSDSGAVRGHAPAGQIVKGSAHPTATTTPVASTPPTTQPTAAPNTNTASSNQSTNPTTTATTAPQVTVEKGTTPTTSGFVPKPLVVSVLDQGNPNLSPAPETSTPTTEAPTTTTPAPEPAPAAVAGPPPEIPDLPASTRVELTNPPVTPTSNSTEVVQGYIIPPENTPKGYDNWDISSSILGHSGFTAADYDNMVAGTGLAGVGAAIAQAEQDTNINGLFILAHMAVESEWGRSNFAKTRDNYWGLGAYTDDPDHAFYFQSVNECLKYYTDLLIGSYLAPQDEYYGGGTTVHKIFIHYSTSDSSSQEQTDLAEDETITGIINNDFLTAAKKAGAQAVAPTPPTTTTTTVPSKPPTATRKSPDPKHSKNK